ncbi:GDP-L-fucose synthase family protein [Adhaeretor mobilis]|uniref:GDP-L-fucose synthase n=1 Tax=Adhaeretor mobilis TaxID=1930276 RepID=A0A517MSA4_9BACT|nr:GDP-L-fucose synthase [Adhaeretor mobilis]QDS97758.1 GDP-L-fucose synthase [Adhaeretor mobilis]
MSPTPKSTSSLPTDAPVYVTGHRGMVGSAMVRCLEAAGFSKILTATRQEVDLRDQRAVNDWFATNKPAYVFHAAGTVGGIHANSSRPADFLYDNLMMHATVLHASWQIGVEKLLYLGSSCIYPRNCPQPIKEEYLLTGPLEVTNDAYAIAKIAGLKSCEAYRRQHDCNFISAMPTNLYGTNDNFDLKTSHVLPALIRKFHDCREAGGGEVSIWGTGSPMREFLHVDDLADACLFLMNNYNEAGIVNVGTGTDVTIRELAELIQEIVCPEAQLTFDTSMPDGTPRKLLDVSKLHNLGWHHKIELREGIARTYDWFQENLAAGAEIRGTAVR